MRSPATTGSTQSGPVRPFASPGANCPPLERWVIDAAARTTPGSFTHAEAWAELRDATFRRSPLFHLPPWIGYRPLGRPSRGGASPLSPPGRAWTSAQWEIIA